ncbi:MAG TPA: hypothetical protein VNZ22_16670, partial [Bacillota bacterium]|nr:hypothetical protein [Bacillota bacterium]
GSDGGDSWNWVSSNPAPFSGSLANQSILAAGLHQHYFASASQTLPVATGETLFAYVYLDPSNLPSELMLQWNDGTWDHRAFWGTDNIDYGTAGTAGRRYMGPLPAAGKWVRLEVPASQVALEGSTVSGMAFSLYGGQATWDAAGKGAAPVTNPPPASGGTTTTNTPPTTTLTNSVIWVDDALPAGSVPAANGGDTWNWVSSNPTPFSGSLANQSAIAAGLHQHYFDGTTKTLTIGSNETLFAYVYIDPNNVPSELMLQWYNGTWYHRAFWGADNISYGTTGTSSRRYMGPLPEAGKWVRLEVPARQVALEGCTINGMAFTQYGGRATWDCAGKASVSATNPPPSSGSTNPPPVTATNSTIVKWVEDALPTGAVAGSDGGDSWNWVSSNPAPFSGSLANQSTIATGLHQHYFSAATQTLAVNSGEVLLASVYLDPSNVPSELMLQWNDGTWEHRAYWGQSLINYGTSGTPGCRYMGPMPPAGQWVLLQVPASQVALEGSTLSGMAFSLYGGRATWDCAGKASAPLSTNQPPANGDTSGSGGTTTNTPPPITTTNTPPSTTPPPTNVVAVTTNSLPGATRIDYLTPQLPEVGANALHILTPTLLELNLINTKQPDPARVSAWDLVGSNGQFLTPSTSAFSVTANGQPVAVLGVGFKRRPLYAPLAGYDLRIENS